MDKKDLIIHVASVVLILVLFFVRRNDKEQMGKMVKLLLVTLALLLILGLFSFLQGSLF